MYAVQERYRVQRQLSTPSSEKVAQRVIGGGAVSLATYTTYCLRIV
jgi:hypothetical protein